MLDAASSPADSGSRVEEMRRATIEMASAVKQLESALGETEQRLAAEREQHRAAERRGEMAQKIGDTETAEIAHRYADRHQGWVEVLERKLDAQRRELVLVRAELDDMRSRVKEVAEHAPATEATDAVDRAWREIERLGGSRPETDVKDDYLRAQMDRAAKERMAEEQLKELKRRMGR